MRTRRLLALVLVTTVVAGACSSSHHAATGAKSTTTTTSKVAYSSQKQLVADIDRSGLTPERAELYFSLMFGPLPGVSTKGIAPDPIEFDGTSATDDIEREWSSLSTAQRKAVAADLKGKTLPAGSSPPPSLAAFMAGGSGPTAAGGATTTTAPPSTTTTTVAAIPTTSSAPTATTASARRGARPTYELAVATPAFTDEEYVDGAQAAMQSVAGQFGLAPIPVVVVFNDDAIPGAPYAETHLYGEPWYENTAVRWPDGCHITVFDQGAKMQGISGNLTELAAVLVHESTHCFQQQTAGSPAAANAEPDWIAEGGATWAMAQVVPEATVYIKCWQAYLDTPQTPYVARSYDGIGLFGHEGDLTSQESIWGKLLPMIAARVGEGGTDTAAWNILVGSGSDQYYSTWGASYFLDGADQTWDMQGPGQVPTSGPAPTSVTIGNDDGQQIGTGAPYQANLVTIQGDADILVITLGSGYGQVHDQGYGLSSALDDTQPLKLCLKDGGCKCPDGTPGASAFTTQATGPISVGLDGGDHSLAAYAAGLSLDKFCKKPDPQPPTGGGQPPPGGGGGGGGGVDPDPDPNHPGGTSEGDPHLSTFDGRYYDLQVAGELTMVRSTTDDLEVQARLVPLAGTSTVAVNQAVAAKVDVHRVTISLENGSIVTRLDGTQLVQVNTPAGSGTVDRLGTTAVASWVVEWSDGTRLEIGQLGLQGLNLQLWPAADRAGKLVGPLGNDNGKPADDLALADGTALSSPNDQTLDTTYANSWRVSQATSLFDYAPGQTSATFTDTSFPQGPVVIPDKAAITKQCQADGITDPYLLQACIVDASAIHDPAGSQAVLSHYAHAQTVRTVRYDLAHDVKPFKTSSSSGAPTTAPTDTSTPGGSGAALKTLVDSGRVNDPHESQAFTFPAKAGDVIWIGPPGCDNQLTLALKDPSGKVLDPNDVGLGLSGCQIGRFALTSTGTYQLVVNPDHQGAGSYGIPIRFERPDVVKSTSYGQTLSGTIPMSAAHDVYTFKAHAGDVVHLGGSGCSLGFAHPVTVGQQDDVDIVTTSGKPVVLLGCEKSAALPIPVTGTYKAIVNFANVGPFSYHFQLQK